MAPKLFLRVLMFVILLSTHLTAGNRKPESNSSAYDVLYAAGEQILGHIPKSINSIDLSSLDPFTINLLKINLDNPSIKLKGKMENVVGTGLKHFKVTKCEVHTILLAIPYKMTMSVHIPFLDIIGKHYDIVGSFGKLFNLFGNGTFSMLFSGIDVSYGANLASLLPLQLRELDIDMRFEKFEGNIKGLMNDELLSELINKVLNEVAPEAFQLLWPVYKPAAKEIIRKIVNDILRDFNYSFIDALKVAVGCIFHNVRNSIS